MHVHIVVYTGIPASDGLLHPISFPLSEGHLVATWAQSFFEPSLLVCCSLHYSLAKPFLQHQTNTPAQNVVTFLEIETGLASKNGIN
jgi:hypothetical protein